MSNNESQITKDPSLYHLPPQNIEAEESILSSILIDNSTLLDVMEILSPEDFYRSSHQNIFAGIAELFSKNEPADLVTLTNLLREKNQLEEIGGAAYLAQIIDTAPLAVNAQHYARIVHDKAALRRMIEKANAISQRCFKDQGDVDEIIDFAESAIFEIARKKDKQSFYPLSKIIEENIDTLEERQGNKALLTGVPTGFTLFDNLTSGLQKSDLIIIA
ncbi:MAG TPA: replicative DNA helicase, partial [Desulfobacterales bacterium]|nr:replicative DNA helicase [Desulfobacterales bacterium]